MALKIRKNNTAKVSTTSIFLVLAVFLLVFVAAENSTGNETVFMANNSSFNVTLNESLENESLFNETVGDVINETVPVNETEEIIINETEIIEPVINDTAEEIIIEQVIDETSPESSLIFNQKGEAISYELETDGTTTYLYPDLVIDTFEFNNLAGHITLIELGRLQQKHDFIQTFVIDTSELNFNEGLFTKVAGGSALYKCIEWNGETCNSEWQFVRELEKGQDYTLQLEQEITAYGELYQPAGLGIMAETETQADIRIQAEINSTQADGLVAYEQRDSATPLFRLWNSSNEYDAESSASSLGSDGTNDIAWVVVKGSHERDEIIMGTVDKEPDSKVQVYTPSRGWANLQVLAETAPAVDYRSMDIAYEDISGDALIVYDDATSDNTIYYRIWNGSAYSSESTFTLGFTDTTTVGRWVSLVSRAGTDEIMLLVHNDVGDLYAVPWNGTGFDSSKENEASTGTTSSTEQHFAFSWETQGGGGLLSYGEGTAPGNYVYNDFDGTTWGDGGTFGLGNDGLDALRSCSEPNSNYVGVIWQDDGDDVNARVWDGDSLLAGIGQDGGSEANGASNVNVDCAWLNSTTALFGFVESNELSMEYFFYTIGTGWTGAGAPADIDNAAGTANFADDDIKGLRMVEHPTTEEVMIIAQDIDEYVFAIRWDGSSFVIPPGSGFPENGQIASSLTEILNAASESAMFDWYRYDPVPNVTSINPNGANYSYSATVNINATVTDNINVSVVLANVTLPNGTIEQLTLTDTDSDNIYNNTFSTTTVIGTYTIRIIANDTSIHQNINSTETSTFEVIDTVIPNVTGLLPFSNATQNEVFNVSNIIEVAANVSDDVTVDTVLANVSIPNGSITQLTLSLATGTKYNVSYTIPAVIGAYNITIVANDTANNINSTETTNFTVNDIANPNITALIPAASSVFNVSNTIEVAANVSDDVELSAILANVTYPNGTINQLTLSLATGSKYNNSLTAPALTGTYNITFIANDTTNNINSSETSNFTVNDVTYPSVAFVTPLVGSSFTQSASVSITATITDDVNISYVFANVTLPDSTYDNVTLTDQGSNVYGGSFTNTSQAGTYTIKLVANDSSNNINDTVNRTFTINDANDPVVTLVSPVDESTQTSSSVTFTCNATDNANLANITLYHNISGSFTANETNTSFSGTANQTDFVISVPDGTYAWNCFASDAGGNTAFAAANRTLSVDTTNPNVTALIPAASSIFNVSNVIEIAANVADNFAVSIVLANITYPNGTINQLTLSLATGSKYNNSFTVPALLGVYNVTFIANDTTNNINSSETTNFTVNDVNTLSLTVVGCTPTNINLSQTIECNATATDDIGIDTVTANVTLPNGTVESQTVENVSSSYNFTFTNSVLVGEHTISWWVNDTSNNQETATASFNVSDVTNPAITLNHPVNTSNTSLTSVTFNFTATDNYYSTINCSLVLDGATNQTNSSTINGSNTLITVTGFNDGDHNWNITCSDNSTNSNTSATRIFTVDTGNPLFHTLTTSPSSADDLDPNVNVTIIANVSENTTALDTVIFQRKLSNESSYTNITMVLNSGDGFYNTSFNATQNGTYNLRLWANDTVGNSDYSALTNITVESDRTWTRTPSTFTAITASASANVTMGNLTINNTGDYSLDFNITSDSSTTIYNETENFTLAAKGVKILQINETAPSVGLKTITLNISVNDSLADSTSLTSTGTVVVAPGQPVLVATFTTPSTETLSVTQGDANVVFSAKLDNLGEGNASSVDLFFTLPSEWTVTYDPGENLNYTFGDFDSGESESYAVEVTIPSNATTGNYVVYVNTTGTNASGADLTSENLTFGDTVDVTVGSTATLGSGTTGGGGGTSDTGGTTASTGGGGGGGTTQRVSKTVLGSLTESIETEEVFPITRGSGASTPVTVANLWENAQMENISLSVSGFLAQYVVVSPELNENIKAEITSTPAEPQSFTLRTIGEHTLTVEEIKVGKVTVTLESEPQTLDLKTGQIRYVDLDKDGKGDLALELVEIIGNTPTIKAYAVKDYSQSKLVHGETLDYSLDLYAPTYLVQKDYELELEIEATLIPDNATAAGFTDKVITEFRKLLFRIQEVGGEDAEEELNLAKEKVEEMIKAEFNTVEVSDLLTQANDAFNETDYDLVSQITTEILKIHKTAFAAHNIIQEVEESIKKADEKWLKTPQTEEALQLALLAFERGDYSTALERAKNAQLIQVLETKGKVNILKFIIDWWWALLLGLVVLCILTYFTYKYAHIAIIEQRLKNLNKEESTIGELLEETQKKYLKDKSLSEVQYKHYTEQYEKRLTKVRQVRAKLRNKRVAILKTEQELKGIQKERKEVQELLKQNQTDYLVKGKLSRKKFTDKEKQHKGRLAEIEQEEAILQEKLDKEKGTRRYSILAFLSRIFGGEKEETKKKPVKKLKKEPKKKAESKKQTKKVPQKSLLVKFKEFKKGWEKKRKQRKRKKDREKKKKEKFKEKERAKKEQEKQKQQSIKEKRKAEKLKLKEEKTAEKEKRKQEKKAENEEKRKKKVEEKQEKTPPLKETSLVDQALESKPKKIEEETPVVEEKEEVIEKEEPKEEPKKDIPVIDNSAALMKMFADEPSKKEYQPLDDTLKIFAQTAKLDAQKKEPPKIIKEKPKVQPLQKEIIKPKPSPEVTTNISSFISKFENRRVSRVTPVRNEPIRKIETPKKEIIKEKPVQIEEEPIQIKDEKKEQKLPEKFSLFNLFNKNKPEPPKQNDPYAGKWVEIKVKEPDEKKVMTNIPQKEEPKVINTPKKEVKPMSKDELKKWFPGAFE